MCDEDALPYDEISSLQMEDDRRPLQSNNPEREPFPPSTNADNVEVDPCQELLTDFNATGNHAIRVLQEVSDSLHATEQDLADTRQILASNLSHEELVYQGGIIALLKTMEVKDEMLGYHVQRMVLFSIEIARWFGIADLKELKAIIFIAALHDVGKVSIRDEILNKPGFFSDEERAHVENHSAIGAKIVECVPGWEEISRGVLSHHEWWDGTGYPNGWSGEQISLASRIVAVADVFDAVTSLRPYREPFPYFAARVHIERESASHFDPQVVAAFLKVPETRWEELRQRAKHSTLEDLLQIPLSELDLTTWSQFPENGEDHLRGNLKSVE